MAAKTFSEFHAIAKYLAALRQPLDAEEASSSAAAALVLMDYIAANATEAQRGEVGVLLNKAVGL